MKYIRTKDFIALIEHDFNGASCVKDNNGIWHWLEDVEKDFHKQADTIPELCDEICETFEIVDQKKFDKFMVDKPLYLKEHFKKPIVQKYDLFDLYSKEELVKAFFEKDNELGIKTTIYGAIWTDKGLIYAAKMEGILPNGDIDWELL